MTVSDLPSHCGSLARPPSMMHVLFIVIHVTALVLFAFALWITIPLHIAYAGVQLRAELRR